MRSPELIQCIQDSMTLLIESSDELRDLDQVLGDGDLGITISAGARAVIEALKAMPTEPEPAPSDVARACAKAFANANPSTMAALVAGGLLAGSKVWVGCEDITAVEAEAFIRAAASSISHRGKSQVGDKTILDAMVPAVDSLARSIEANPAVAHDSALTAAALDSAIVDAGEAVVATRDLQSQRGRASWLQDRSIGLQDPGATAFLRALEAWRDASTGERAPRAAGVSKLCGCGFMSEGWGAPVGEPPTRVSGMSLVAGGIRPSPKSRT